MPLPYFFYFVPSENLLFLNYYSQNSYLFYYVSFYDQNIY